MYEVNIKCILPSSYTNVNQVCYLVLFITKYVCMYLYIGVCGGWVCGVCVGVWVCGCGCVCVHVCSVKMCAWIMLLFAGSAHAHIYIYNMHTFVQPAWTWHNVGTLQSLPP